MAGILFADRKPGWRTDFTKVLFDNSGYTRGIDRLTVGDWIDANCSGDYHLYTNCIIFEKEQDVVIFKLRWD